MGRLFLEYVDDEEAGGRYCCGSCSCDIASSSGLIWQGMMGQCQPALLFRAAVNVELAGSPRQEALSSGRYTLQDVRCRACAASLGWQYLEVHSGDQQYKKGTFLLSEDALEHQPCSSGGSAARAAAAAAAALSDSSSGDELPRSSYRSSRTATGRAPVPGLGAGYLRSLRGVQQRQAA